MKAIDRYQPLEMLGRGGFGTVFRARHVHTGELVALKVLESPAAEIGHRVLREARALAGLVHPNVVRVLDCGITDTGEIFVAMELAQGVELAKLLEMGTGPLPMRRAIGIAQQILFGLSAVHARGIVHRDVKPSNIVVATEVGADGSVRDFVRLIDFGISKLTGETAMLDRTRPGMSMGTPGYMAPEQLGSAHAADARADLYAVAVILYQMLSGTLPHRAPSYEDYVVAVRTTPPPPLGSVASHIPRSLEAAIMHGLERDPRARFSSAQEFGAALEGCANDVAAVSAAATVRAGGAPEHAPLPRPPNTSGGPTPPPTAQPTLGTAAKRSSPWPWVGLGGALLLAVAGGSLAVWLATPTARQPTSSSTSTSTSTSAAANATAATPTSAAAKPTAETSTSTSTSAAVKATAGTSTSKASGSLPLPVPALSASARPSSSPSPCGKGGSLPVVIASAPGVKVGPGRVVGAAEASWVDAVARHGAASVGVCRPECGSELVTVHLFLQASGLLGLVGPSPDNTGDPSAARCVADHMKTGAPKHDPKLASSATGGPHGIVTYAVLLDRK